MMNAKRKKILHSAIFSLILVFTVFTCPGQVYSVKATVDKHKILLGEQFLFTLEVAAEQGYPYTLPVIDTIPHFEILEKFDPQHSGSTVTQSYRLTSFDSGQWVI